MKPTAEQEMGLDFITDLDLFFQTNDPKGTIALIDGLDRDEQVLWVEALAGWLSASEDREAWLVPILSAHQYGWTLLMQAEALLRYPVEVPA